MAKIVSATAIQASVLEASRPLNCFWPLTSFIACNSLKGFENRPFEAAMRRARQLFNARGFLSLAEYRALYESGRIRAGDVQEACERNNKLAEVAGVASDVDEHVFAPIATLADFIDEVHGTSIVMQTNQQLVKWCSAYFDCSQAQWSTPKDGLYNGWRQLVGFDYSLTLQGSRNWKNLLSELPPQADRALEFLLAKLGVEEHELVQYLQKHLVQLPGWASHLKWRSTQGESEILTDYLAMRLFYELSLSEPIVQSSYKGVVRPWAALSDRRAIELAKSDASVSKASDWSAIWQEGYEINYRNRLIADLRRSKEENHSRGSGAELVPTCQLVFCIDVRSEPIRRSLETIGNYATYGFAGFFGFAMRLQPLNSNQSIDLCPVLISPDKFVREAIGPGAQALKAPGFVGLKDRACRLASVQALLASSLQLRKRLKASLIGAFGLVETFGLWSALPLVGRTFWPQTFQGLFADVKERLFPTPCTHLDTSAFSLAEKITLAEGCLKGIGITDNFAKVVVFCGHKSTSANNPYASALDCGACGGNSGGYSARLAAQILNQADVRSGLLARGIVVPAATIFVAAEHDTTDDRFEVFNVNDSLELDSAQREIVEQLRRDLAAAGEIVRSQRLKRLPQSVIDSFNSTGVRGFDWAQVAPEWGLAGNAAFIAAPRSLTKGLDLKGRTFLHSYEHSKDQSNAVLEIIMTAPLVVAQWINMQYYLSTVDNDVFGSGSKVIHNVVGDFGVMRGASGDLQLGLPWQSVMAADGTREHEPMRLLALIQAPRDAIDSVLAKHQSLADLVKNRWLRLVALETGGHDQDVLKFYQADARGDWREIQGDDCFVDESMASACELIV